MKNRLPRCTWTNRDGTQCSRRVRDASSPAQCHIHLGKLNSPVIPTEVDEIGILKRLARDPNPQIKLRAVDLLLSLKTPKGCPTCAAAATTELRVKNLMDYATPEQRVALAETCQRLVTLKTTILGYVAAGGQPFAKPQPIEEPESDDATEATADPSPVAAPPQPVEMVQVWRDGQLVPEPRANRPWRKVSDLL
jgi:hypothetical protein